MMQKSLAIIICLVLAFTSCKEQDQPHLSRKQMQNILTDLHLAEVYSTMKNEDNSSNKNMDSLAYFYKSILEHHNVKVSDLKSSLEWYSNNAKELDSVYINVMTELSTIEGVIAASKNSPQQ